MHLVPHSYHNPQSCSTRQVDGSLKLPESGAIICYLADKYRDQVGA